MERSTLLSGSRFRIRIGKFNDFATVLRDDVLACSVGWFMLVKSTAAELCARGDDGDNKRSW